MTSLLFHMQGFLDNFTLWSVGLVATLTSAACVIAADTGAYFVGACCAHVPPGAAAQITVACSACNKQATRDLAGCSCSWPGPCSWPLPSYP